MIIIILYVLYLLLFNKKKCNYKDIIYYIILDVIKLILSFKYNNLYIKIFNYNFYKIYN